MGMVEAGVGRGGGGANGLPFQSYVFNKYLYVTFLS